MFRKVLKATDSLLKYPFSRFSGYMVSLVPNRRFAAVIGIFQVFLILIVAAFFDPVAGDAKRGRKQSDGEGCAFFLCRRGWSVSILSTF